MSERASSPELRAVDPSNPSRVACFGGFTLIELLVSVALIALLAGLLLPSLIKSSQLADSTRCLAHLRQVGLASQLYWDDHGGRAFTERSIRTNNGWTYWFGWLADGSEGLRKFDPSPSPLWPYLQNQKIGICPALNRSATDFKSKAQGAAYGFGYNLLVGTRGESGIRISTLQAPSDLVVFADCAQINDFQLPATPDKPLLEEFYYFDLTTPTIHFRHREKAQCWFADGHLAGEIPRSNSLDTRLPLHILGLLRENQIRP
jgi:prepilin-type N-terminal cleavage/methylation domain-containing protein/prepilin-type processing-associated H-X9-DG protein